MNSEEGFRKSFQSMDGRKRSSLFRPCIKREHCSPTTVKVKFQNAFLSSKGTKVVDSYIAKLAQGTCCLAVVLMLKACKHQSCDECKSAIL